MEKSRIIIVEGSQGVGKTTLVNYLRENIPSSNLYRLSGQADKTEKGKKASEKMYFALQDYIDSMQGVPMDLLFDRTFFSEEVYARLGYKEYSFTDVYEKLVERLNNTSYDVYLIILYLKDTEEFNKRLKRVHHNYHKFSIDTSVKQQNTYLELADELSNTNIKTYKIAMDDFEKGYQEIDKILEIGNK